MLGRRTEAATGDARLWREQVFADDGASEERAGPAMTDPRRFHAVDGDASSRAWEVVPCPSTRLVMGMLRDRMEVDVKLRGLSLKTQRSY